MQGWTASVYAGGFGSATVDRSVFDDVDVAFQPLGALAAARFAGNTVSRANGNTILMVGKTDWDISGNIFSRDFAQRHGGLGVTCLHRSNFQSCRLDTNLLHGFSARNPT